MNRVMTTNEIASIKNVREATYACSKSKRLEIMTIQIHTETTNFAHELQIRSVMEPWSNCFLEGGNSIQDIV